MRQEKINAHIRVIKIMADMLNSKPTDWVPDYPGTGGLELFETVFRALYDEGKAENDCLPVTTDMLMHLPHSRLGSTRLDKFKVAIENTSGVPIFTIPGEVIEQWTRRR